MSVHVHDELPLLLRGEADRATVSAAGSHLRGCPDCQQELVSALVAHAALSSAVRYAPDTAGTPADLPASDESPAAPDLSAVFAQVRAEAAGPAGPPPQPERPGRHRGRGRAGWLAAAAAVVGLAVGGGAVALAEHTGGPPAAHSVALAPYGVGTRPATAKIIDNDEMKIDATSLPVPGPGKLYQVWLTDAARKSLHPLGWVQPAGTAQFSVPTALLEHYSAIEVSVQAINAPYAYSGVSVLRGRYR